MNEMKMKTKSLCPQCLKVIDAEVYESDGKILIKKRCEEHGEFDDTYWSDAELYHKFARWQYEGKAGITLTKTDKGCPFDCGLCPEHKSSTMLAIIDLTNRCNQHCPTCFANAAVAGYLYEPTMKQLEEMMKLLRSEVPPCPAVQFAGGEPTIREGFVDIVKMAHKIGFAHVQVATNGIALANSEQFCRDLVEAGLHTVYLQFDGVTDEPYKVLRGIPALKTKLKAIENCRKGGLRSVMLVPTLMKGVNDHQIGDMVKFAAKNLDVVRGVNAQPISFEGRVDESERKERRLTIPDFIKRLEEQTDGEIPRESFYPVPFVLPFSYFVEAWKGIPLLEFTVHPHCGAATYVFVENGKFIPITEFIDVEGLMEFLMEGAVEIKKSRIGRLKTMAKLILSGEKFIDREKAPDVFNENFTTFTDMLKEGNRDSLAKFHRKTIFIGVMHFQDAFNFDLERVKRCGIHYATPDGRIIPFCSYNAIHRPSVEKAFSTPLRKPHSE
ncbi:7,8-dihydro-6-hydroxymethylpterin dimethyltransferase [ANME-1 cluster archaeon GoMg2]|nr:7,8-dihydro-6-hydroxymethylpterin dimethyltransferase [ANME-1 cluster archaeon GoMg2]